MTHPRRALGCLPAARPHRAWRSESGHAAPARYRGTGSGAKARLPIVRDMDHGPGGANLSRCEPLKVKAVLCRAGFGAPGMHVARSSQFQTTDAMQHRCLGFCFKVHPQLIGAHHQRNIVGTLGVGVPKDTRVAGMRPRSWTREKIAPGPARACRAWLTPRRRQCPWCRRRAQSPRSASWRGPSVDTKIVVRFPAADALMVALPLLAFHLQVIRRIVGAKGLCDHLVPFQVVEGLAQRGGQKANAALP